MLLPLYFFSLCDDQKECDNGISPWAPFPLQWRGHCIVSHFLCAISYTLALGLIWIWWCWNVWPILVYPSILKPGKSWIEPTKNPWFRERIVSQRQRWRLTTFGKLLPPRLQPFFSGLTFPYKESWLATVQRLQRMVWFNTNQVHDMHCNTRCIWNEKSELHITVQQLQQIVSTQSTISVGYYQVQHVRCI